MQIERVDQRWDPPEAEVAFRYLQEEIAKCFALPPWALRSPDAHALAMRRAYVASELIRREAVRVLIEHCRPSIILRM